MCKDSFPTSSKALMNTCITLISSHLDSPICLRLKFIIVTFKEVENTLKLTEVSLSATCNKGSENLFIIALKIYSDFFQDI